MTRELVESKLAYIGLNPALKGFKCVVEIMLMMPEEPDKVTVLYTKAAKVLNTSASCVERRTRTVIDTFYNEHANVHTLLRTPHGDDHITVGSFLYKVQKLLKEDVGYFSDGSMWAILCLAEGFYEARIYTTGGNYRLCRGTYGECLKQIMNGGIDNVIR